MNKTRKQIFNYLKVILTENCPDYRFGQLIFNKITTGLYDRAGIEDQSYAINIAAKSDDLFWKLLNYKDYDVKRQQKCSFRQKRDKYTLIELAKRASELYPSITILQLAIEACKISDTFISPSALYFVEDHDMMLGFEIIITLQKMKSKHECACPKSLKRP